MKTNLAFFTIAWAGALVSAEEIKYQSPLDQIVDGIHVPPPTELRWPPDDAGKYVIASEGIRLAFSSNGGALTNLWINGSNGEEVDVVLGFDAVDDYLNYKGESILGGVLGRYAGIISGAGFEIDGIRYNTSANSHGGKATMDGGSRGWGRIPLNVASHTSSSLTFTVFEAMVGTNGFPGHGASSLTHTVKPFEWIISYGVTPCRTNQRVPISLSHQVFWNLDGFAKSSTKDVSDHTLHLPFSGLRVDTDEHGIPTGDLKGNKVGTEPDFWSRPKSLEAIISRTKSYDESFLISRSQPWDVNAHPVAVLESSRSKIKLEVYTDQDAVQLQTWHGLQDLKLKRGQGGSTALPHAAISMRMQDWPDALNHPEWQREDKVLWGPDRLYTTRSRFKFSVGK